MGIFDIFKNKRKQVESSKNSVLSIALTDFNCFYLYGLTDNPFRQSKDFNAFNELYKNVIGAKGGIIIGSSFHPYQLVNPKGTTVWHAGYVQLYVNEKKDEVFRSIINGNNAAMVNPSAAFKEIMVWPDTRLTFEENPIFSKYVPFIIPFLVYKSSHPNIWNVKIQQGMATKGNANEYVGQITNQTRFFMPEPSFILGFDEFDETNPSKLIDNFINCKKLLGQ